MCGLSLHVSHRTRIPAMTCQFSDHLAQLPENHRYSHLVPDTSFANRYMYQHTCNPNMLGSLVDCHNDACYCLPLSSDGFGGVPHQLYRLPARGPLAIKIWAVLLYHGHIVSSSHILSPVVSSSNTVNCTFIFMSFLSRKLRPTIKI